VDLVYCDGEEDDVPLFPPSKPERSARPTIAIVIEPPVTKRTLSELDVNRIIHNPKLRHDINFDPDLHFRPNLDGEKGRRKTEKAAGFWETMRTQLRKYITNREQFEADMGTELYLPAIFKAIRGIVETPVPERDQSLRSRRHRRGRGPRQVIGLNGSDDPTDPVCHHIIATLSFLN
jgi:hypothetical protein